MCDTIIQIQGDRNFMEELTNDCDKLFQEISSLIQEAKRKVAVTANSEITILFWKIGNRVNQDILGNSRAGYGQQIVVTLSRQLVERYGKSYEEKKLRRMIQFASVFSDFEIVATLSRYLSWSHFVALIPIRDDTARDFYAELCRYEKWDVRTLRKKINSMLYERTAISTKPEELIKKELEELRRKDIVSPDLVFHNPYFLDFTGLEGNFKEKTLEDMLLNELEKFIMELGTGFAFIERQKHMVIDGEDFFLDMLFFNRALHRLIAVELKLGQFRAAYKGQMELYLRWLEKYEMQEGEETPLGLILCTEGGSEQIELLQLDQSGIRVSQYLTVLPEKKLLKEQITRALEEAKKRQAFDVEDEWRQ